MAGQGSSQGQDPAFDISLSASAVVQGPPNNPRTKFSASVRLKLYERRFITGAVVGASAMAVVWYMGGPSVVMAGVTRVVQGLGARAINIRLGSIIVELCCETEESFLSVMDAYNTMQLRERFEEELKKIGFQGELEVAIINVEEVYEILDQVTKRKEGSVIGKEVTGMEQLSPISFVKLVVLLMREDISSVGADMFLGFMQRRNVLKKGRKQEINFTPSMTENDVRDILEKEFPVLKKEKRFSCAAVRRSGGDRLDFSGYHRVWDGRTIERLVRGNSNLYIVLEDKESTPQTEVQGRSVSTSEKETLPEVGVEMATTGFVEPDWLIEDIGLEEDSLVDNVIRIIPSRSSLKGGVPFKITFESMLPEHVTKGLATFTNLAVVPLVKLDSFAFLGSAIPAGERPGPVTVEIKTDEGQYLGETQFVYMDEKKKVEVIKQMLSRLELSK